MGINTILNLFIIYYFIKINQNNNNKVLISFLKVINTKIFIKKSINIFFR